MKDFLVHSLGVPPTLEVWCQGLAQLLVTNVAVLGTARHVD